MPPENKNEGDGAPQNSAGDGGQVQDSISLSKKEYEELLNFKATTGSLKRDLKDLQQALDEAKKPKETPSTNQPDNSLLQKSFLRSAGILEQDEVELALSTAKKWGVEVDALVDDGDFKVKLEKLRTEKANAAATTNVPGGGAGSSGAKDTPEYWLSQGRPPSREEVKDRKTRAKIARSFLESARPKAGFYNE